jgi:hypothetical protein
LLGKPKQAHGFPDLNYHAQLYLERGRRFSLHCNRYTGLSCPKLMINGSGLWLCFLAMSRVWALE